MSGSVVNHRLDTPASPVFAPCISLTTKDGLIPITCIYVKGDHGVYAEDINQISHRLDAVHAGEQGTLVFYSGTDKVSSVPFIHVYKETTLSNISSPNQHDPLAVPLSSLAVKPSIRTEGFSVAEECFVEREDDHEKYIAVGSAITRLSQSLESSDGMIRHLADGLRLHGLRIASLESGIAQLTSALASLQTDLAGLQVRRTGDNDITLTVDEEPVCSNVKALPIITCHVVDLPREVIEIPLKTPTPINVLPASPPMSLLFEEYGGGDDDNSSHADTPDLHQQQKTSSFVVTIEDDEKPNVDAAATIATVSLPPSTIATSKDESDNNNKESQSQPPQSQAQIHPEAPIVSTTASTPTLTVKKAPSSSAKSTSSRKSKKH